MSPYFSAGFLINDSLFYHLPDSSIVGLEVVAYIDAAAIESSISFYPQVHFQLTPALRVQGSIL
jgi:hypothetical protein